MSLRMPCRVGKPLLTGALLTAALLAGGGSGAAAQTLAPRDVARGTTVESRSRPDYDPLGVRLGGFRLNGSVEAGAGYDSNLFGRPSNVTGDGYATEAGNVSLNSDWTRHAVGVSASMESRQYFTQNDLDWNDYNIGGFGRYDFSADTNVDVAYRHYQQHFDVYNFDVQAAGIARPVPYNSDEVQATTSTRFNRVGLLATGLYRTFRFEDVNLGTARTAVSLNDFDTAIGAVGATYALSEGRFLTAIVRLQDIKYSNAISRARDSLTWEGLLGFQYDFDGFWQGRIGVGWRQRNYEGNIKTLEGLALEGSLTYIPTQLTTVTFSAARTIEESIRRDAVSYLRTTAALRVDHEFLRNVILGGEVRADRREYDSPRQKATDGVLQFDARYLLNRNIALVGTYAYSQRLENTGGFQEYDRNLIQLRLRLAL